MSDHPSIDEVKAVTVADRPTPETEAACACPVDWESFEGFSDNLNDALDALISEWIRCFSEHAIASEDTFLLMCVTLKPDLYTPSSDEKAIIANILARRSLAEAEYMAGIGRLSRLRFLRPSEHGKHYSVSGPKKGAGKQSYFYMDAKRETLATFFWDWVDDTFMPSSDFQWDGQDEFAREVRHLWDELRYGRKLRIAIYTTVVIGEMDGQPLMHIALDLDFETATAHAYPITEAEAVSIMGDVGVRPHKPAEVLTI